MALRPPCRGIGLANGKGYVCAGVVFEDWNGKSIVAHMVNRERLTRKFLWTVGDYAFNQVKAFKVIAPIWSDNTRMQHVAGKMGFVLEARIHGATPTGDLLLYTLRKEDYRYGKESTSAAVA